MQKYVLDRNGNVVTTFASDYNDKHTKTLEAGASTYEFTISKQDEAALFLETGNYVNFVDDVGKPWSFSILSYTETHNEKTVYCEDVGIELINKNVNAYKADAAYSFAFYFEMITKNTPWTIGINEIGDLSRKLEWTSNDTGLSRLLSLLTEFDNAECKFNVKFAQNKPTEFKVDIYKQIGNPSTNVQIVYSNELNDITKTESRAEFVTAIQGEGGTPTKNPDGSDIVTGTNPDGTTIETPKITFADIEYADENFVSHKGDNFLRAVTANKLFNPNSQDTYIEGYYSYDTESPQELLNRTLTQLKKYSAPQYTYEADVQIIDKNLDLGDTVKIIDHDYKPGLYLEARVASLEKSYTDPSKNTITFTNYRLVNSSLAQKLADLQNIINSMPTASGISSIVTNVINNSNVIEQKILALQSADGRSTVYYDAKPSNAKEGDTAFVKNPNSGNMEIWNYVGDKWTLTAGDATFDNLKTQIDKAQADAQTAIDTANNAVSVANDNATKIGTDITTLKSDVAKSVADVGAKADTAIKSANEALEQIGTANSDLTTIKSDMDTVKGTLKTVATSEQLDGVNKTAVSAKSLAETNAESIKNTVTKTELTTAKSEWSSAQSVITAGQISTEITKVNQTISDTTKNLVSQKVLNNAIVNSETGTKQVISESIANISVGGRNYIKNSDQTITINGDTDHYKSMYTNLTAEYWTYSAEVKYVRGSDTSVYLAIFSADTTMSYNTVSVPIVNGKISWTFKPNNPAGVQLLMFASSGAWATTTGKTLEVSKHKLEKGNKATDWTPAPEDQASVTAVNAIEQTFDGMKQTIANAATKTEVTKLASQVTSTISAVQGGGANLYTDTKNFNNLASWYASSAWTKTTDIYKGLGVVQTTTNWSGLSQYIKVKKGDILTYSVYAKNISGTGTSTIYWQLGSQIEGSYSKATANPSYNDVTITDSWQRVSSTTVATSDGYLRPRLERTNTNTNTLQIAGIKVEKGTIATPYSQAPEDIQSQITQTQSMIDARVEKSGVVNAINISPESIQIYGNKLHITATTYIDSGIITNAMIANATITGAQIANATIVDANIANINGNKIVANSITADKLAVNALLVGLDSAMGDNIEMAQGVISFNQSDGYKMKMDSSGLAFGKFATPTDAVASLTIIPSVFGISGLHIQGDALITGNIYGRGTNSVGSAYGHFDNSLTFNGSAGIAFFNGAQAGIWIGNNNEVRVVRDGTSKQLI
ncbi:hypothetical protein [Jeotgalibaca porci]|uniref:hypothetical protein n=1 Tax=Jeotgalibaca porci TaxID=1868793 RepID=UPI0035A1A6C4